MIFRSDYETFEANDSGHVVWLTRRSASTALTTAMTPPGRDVSSIGDVRVGVRTQRGANRLRFTFTTTIALVCFGGLPPSWARTSNYKRKYRSKGEDVYQYKLCTRESWGLLNSLYFHRIWCTMLFRQESNEYFFHSYSLSLRLQSHKTSLDQ